MEPEDTLILAEGLEAFYDPDLGDETQGIVCLLLNGTELCRLSPNQAIRLGEWASKRQERYS